MSDKENKEQELQSDRAERLDRSSEPKAGEGPRSLQNWQNLAKVRESLSADAKNREQYELDPIGYMQRFGVDVGSMAAPGQGGGEAMAHLQNLEAAAGEGPDVQLAFCKVWGVVVAVAGVVANAGANANAVANANAGVNINAGANLNVNVNGVGPAYEE
jgi:hypothetical protein